MTKAESNKPVLHLYVGGHLVAKLFDPQHEDMFWCSYRLESVDGRGDLIMRDIKVWEGADFMVRDMGGCVPNPHVISGDYKDFCERRTDRLAFRSLWPA